MGKFIIGVIAVIIAGLAAIFVTKGETEVDTTPTLDFATVQTDVANGAKFYDVRTP